MKAVKVGAITLAAIFILIGLLTVGRGAYTLYNDYQDFKAIRQWVINKNNQDKQRAQPAQPAQ